MEEEEEEEGERVCGGDCRHFHRRERKRPLKGIPAFTAVVANIQRVISCREDPFLFPPIPIKVRIVLDLEVFIYLGYEFRVNRGALHKIGRFRNVRTIGTFINKLKLNSLTNVPTVGTFRKRPIL